MPENPFRRRPYLAFGIDALKMLLLMLLALLLFGALALGWW
jgi:hypothetical protein